MVFKLTYKILMALCVNYLPRSRMFWSVFPLPFSSWHLSIVCSLNSSKDYADFVAYLSAVLNINFCLLMIVFCALCFKNVRRNKQIRSITKKDFQLTRCLFVQDVVYIGFSMLVILFYLYLTFSRDPVRTEASRALLNFIGNTVSMVFNMYFVVCLIVV